MLPSSLEPSPVDAALRGSPYVAYTYAYPHKTAYRPLEPALKLERVWASAPGDVFLYVHVPFCEMRCGFCNLFTTVNPESSLEAGFLRALERQARAVRAAVGERRVTRAALGGGTPTYLRAADLERVLRLLREFGAAQNTAPNTPLSVETSPATVTADRLRVLADFGVDRVSIGVQSFIESEARAVGRAQRSFEVTAALEALRQAGFPVLNIDLIYGLPGQTRASWLESLRAALEFAPEELFLYPLYVRPLTGLGKSERSWDDERLGLYRVGRDYLLERGYTQSSMRVFRRVGANPRGDGTAFDAQPDGLIGLGSGARSYTEALHYSSEYAVCQTGVREIISDYLARSEADFALASHGFALCDDERRRRFVLQDLFNLSGVSSVRYQARFGTDLLADFPALRALERHGLLISDMVGVRLTEAGLERSDAIGPLLYSSQVQELARRYEAR